SAFSHFQNGNPCNTLRRYAPAPAFPDVQTVHPEGIDIRHCPHALPPPAEVPLPSGSSALLPVPRISDKRSAPEEAWTPPYPRKDRCSGSLSAWWLYTGWSQAAAHHCHPSDRQRDCNNSFSPC